MIYITGDVHGDIDFGKFVHLRANNVSLDDYLVILGDAGICWSPEFTRKIITMYRKLNITVIFLDGNHENFDMLESLPLVEYKGALMHQIDDHIFHVLRGEIMEIDGYTMLCIGGANSIDKHLRTEHISWWAQEDITDHDIDNAVWNLGRYKNKVDFVLTHCVDSPTVKEAFHFHTDHSSDQLNFVDRVVDYNRWFFGHYHFDVPAGKKKECVYQRIIKLEKKSGHTN